MDTIMTLFVACAIVLAGVAVFTRILEEYGGNNVWLILIGAFIALKWVQAMLDDLNSWPFFLWSWAGFFFLFRVFTRERK